jgi:hypothetical protein
MTAQMPVFKHPIMVASKSLEEAPEHFKYNISNPWNYAANGIICIPGEIPYSIYTKGLAMICSNGHSEHMPPVILTMPIIIHEITSQNILKYVKKSLIIKDIYRVLKYRRIFEGKQFSIDYLNSLIKDELLRIRKVQAARLIQRVWRHVITDPKHDICKSRLLYEFKLMASSS